MSNDEKAQKATRQLSGAVGTLTTMIGAEATVTVLSRTIGLMVAAGESLGEFDRPLTQTLATCMAEAEEAYQAVNQDDPHLSLLAKVAKVGAA